MTRYAPAQRGQHLLWGLITLGFGVLLNATLALQVLGMRQIAGWSNGVGLDTVIGFAFALLPLFLGWRLVFREAEAVELPGDGSLRVYFWPGRSTSIPVLEITEIRLSGRPISMEGWDNRELHITHARGSLLIAVFPNYQRLLYTLVRANPSIQINRRWAEEDPAL